MKTLQISSALALAYAGLSAAYPNILAELESQKKASGLKHRGAGIFDAASQLVDVSGKHAFTPPGSGDQRGPCPGLNALANHNYLPHNGVGTITEFIDSTTSVFGMGADLAAVLAVYGAAIDGNLLEWSIGGPTANVPSINLLGQPQGISGSHNKYEGDASPTRGDLYVDGQDYLLKMKNFQALYDAGKADDNYDLQLLTDRRAARFQENIDGNPYFFNAPFSGVVAQPAAWSFIYRFMANKSAEYPAGKLDGEVLKSFYAITGEDGNFTYTPGHERIPENWYTRNQADPYDLLYLNVDLVDQLLQHLEFASIGGNTGTNNSFVGIDPEELTNGVFNAATLTQGNNAMCYGLQLVVQELPDLLSGVVTNLASAVNQVSSAFGNATEKLGCPKLTQINQDQFNKYPGYTKLKSDGTY
ncbi:Cloroperoxidase, partial [Aureobasidium melanogenum]|uniref:Cloroperoxidase n=1 Tax=Aureobasidium melanogenum (strain CBS 110374) TaxID=1043003 RepID=A0A074WAU4_AURM1